MTTKKNENEANQPKKSKKSGGTALKVAGGVLAGAAAGALTAVLLAPDSGKNTRKKIADI
ncbi:MAG: YtxH domain-containing protein [Bacteroidetes bacterium]|nr:YtxH domain-containing protein [Bacteroidota bacterium]MDA1120587.1 YtxH domain-containing protein [Bacteroidota bacterium]